MGNSPYEKLQAERAEVDCPERDDGRVVRVGEGGGENVFQGRRYRRAEDGDRRCLLATSFFRKRYIMGDVEVLEKITESRFAFSLFT